MVRQCFWILICAIQLNAHWPSIYNPERASYMSNAHNKPKESSCVFCSQLKENNDEQHFIIKRFKHVYIFLNRFPYNPGHMLIMPLRHVAHLEDLTLQECTELMQVAQQAVVALKQIYKVDGVNVGINLGSAAGASKPEHLHVHILPRWHHDTGWLHTLGQTSVMTNSMHNVYDKLKTEFNH